MPGKTNLKRISVFILLLLLAAGCSSSSLKIGWRETSTLSHKMAKYESFNGTEPYSICTKAGDNLDLNYRLEVTKGNLQLKLEDPAEQVVWEKEFRQDADGSFQQSDTQRGCYRLFVSGDQTRGSFVIDWSLDGQGADTSKNLTLW